MQELFFLTALYCDLNDEQTNYYVTINLFKCFYIGSRYTSSIPPKIDLKLSTSLLIRFDLSKKKTNSVRFWRAISASACLISHLLHFKSEQHQFLCSFSPTKSSIKIPCSPYQTCTQHPVIRGVF